MTPEQTSRFRELFKERYSICGGLDPFSYARAREIYMAGEFGHTVADDYSGEDAIDENGKPVEYKSTIAYQWKYSDKATKNKIESIIKK